MKISRAEPLLRHHLDDTQIGLVERVFVKRELQTQGFNRHMFDEDFARLFDLMNRRSGSLFEIVSNDDELIQKLLSNVETTYASKSVDKTISELVEEIAQSLIWFERAFYLLQDDNEQEEIHVISFSSSGIVRLFGTHIQWVPKRRERHWDGDDKELPRELRILDASKVMCFYIPTSIKRMLNAQNKTLAVLDRHQFSETNFHLPVTHENPNPTTHFDFRVWRDTQESALFRATRGTGWDGRKESSNRSEFFDAHRLIRFRRNQLLFRDNILNQLSGELTRVGKYYKANFSVEILGTDELPSVTQLNELEVRLSREEVGFNEIIDYCYNR